MKLHVLFGQRKEQYEGEYAPEPLACWDEFSLDENPEGFDAECARVRAANASEMAATRVITIDVDGDKIRRLLVGTPNVKGQVCDAEPLPCASCGSHGPDCHPQCPAPRKIHAR